MTAKKSDAADALTAMVNAANPEVPYIVIVLSGKDVIMCTSMDDETADATLRKALDGM